MKIVQIEERPFYKIVLVQSDWDEMKEIGHWCAQHQCGKQVSIRGFSFKTDQELTMFRLKWETE